MTSLDRGELTAAIHRFVLAACLVVTSACSEADAPPRNPDARAAADPSFDESARLTVSGYARRGRTAHDEALLRAKLMEKAIEDFMKVATPEAHDHAKAAWRAARDTFVRAEAFRFSGGPLDTRADLAAQVDAWPVDASALEALVTDEAALPQITAPALLERARMSPFPMGFRAIEVILWGTADAPRAVAEFVPPEGAAAPTRRGLLAAKLSRILIESLEVIANGWDSQRQGSFAQTLVQGPLDDAFRRALGGAATLARDEIVGRKLPQLADPNARTTACADVAASAAGLELLLAGHDPKTPAPSWVDLARGDGDALGADTSAALARARAAAADCAAADELRAAHLALADRVELLIRHYGLAR